MMLSLKQIRHQHLSRSIQKCFKSFSTNLKLSFVSDVEGNYSYWQQYAAQSGALYYENVPNDHAISFRGTANNGRQRLALRDSHALVFGGDVCDRGDGDIRIIADLVDLKDRYPNRVFFVIGNRDSNKLRLLSELNSRCIIRGDKVSMPSVYWNANDTTYWGTDDAEKKSENKDLDKASVVARLKWILRRTMGSPEAFESRRAELKVITGNDNITDDDVTQSYLDLIDPHYISPVSSEDRAAGRALIDNANISNDIRKCYGGLLLRYLKHAHVAMRVADLLIVHGAVHNYNIGMVPKQFPREEVWNNKNLTYSTNSSLLESSEKHFDVDKWIVAMERFKLSEVDDYITRSYDFFNYWRNHSSETSPVWAEASGYNHYQPGSRLLQYGMFMLPNRVQNFTVIYGSYLTSNSQPKSPDKETIEWCKSNGINRIIVGHQPHGDCPLVIDEQGIQVIDTDTSYSVNVEWPNSEKDDNGNDIFRSIPSEHVKNLVRDLQTRGNGLMTIEESHLTANNSRGISVSHVNMEVPRSSVDHCYHQLTTLLTCGDDHNNDKNAGKCSSVEIYGRLSNGNVYAYKLPPSNENKFLGKMTSDGWLVKAFGATATTDCHPENDNDIQFYDDRQEESNSKEADSDVRYLLSWSQGFTFRNKYATKEQVRNMFKPRQNE